MNKPDKTLAHEVLTKLSARMGRRWKRLDDGITSRKKIDAAAFRFRKAIWQSHKYIFEDNATEAAMEYSLDLQSMCDAVKWLRPLADFVWIEFNNHAALRTTMGEPSHDAAKRVGYLIEGHNQELRVMTFSVDKGYVYIPLIGWQIFTEPNPHNALVGGKEEDTIKSYLGIHTTPGGYYDKYARQLIQHCHLLTIERPFDEAIKYVVQAEMEDTRGACRRAIALMTMLVHRRLVAARLTEQGQQIRMPSGRTDYYVHNRVGINLPRQISVGRLVKAVQRRNVPTEPRRRHLVEPHWCWSRKTDLSCPHEWIEERDGMRYRCTKCGGARWWKRLHERGDASRGYVFQTRVVERRVQR